jgi:hypothetical protein
MLWNLGHCIQNLAFMAVSYKGNLQTAIQGTEAVSTVTGPWARRPEIRCSISGMATNISSSASRPVLGPNPPPVQWAPESVSPEKKRPRYEADRQTTPSSAEIENKWSCSFISPYGLVAWFWINAQRKSHFFHDYLKFNEKCLICYRIMDNRAVVVMEMKVSALISGR